MKDGKNADYIPELAKVNPDYFAIAIVTTDGQTVVAGDSNVAFALESVSKIFMYALALQDNGEKAVHEYVGLNATGKPFNSVIAIEENPNHLQNPLVNAGAIQITSLIKGTSSVDKWNRSLHFMQQLSDSNLYLSEKIYQSEMATNQHNRAIATLLDSYKMMYSNAEDAVDRYTKACSVMATAVQLATMGATLANDGMNPFSHEKIIEKNHVQDVLSTMVTNGLYENSGKWWSSVGLPSKSGVSGVIISVVPHRMAIVAYSPRLDTIGNSVRAQAAISDLAERWHLHLLANQTTRHNIATRETEPRM
jgi:glutaminase